MRFFSFRLLSIVLSICYLSTNLLGTVQAAVSYDVTNESQMFLNSTITSTQTTGITLAAPQWNGSNVTLATASGAVFRIRQGFKREDIYATATVNATTQVITLAGVVRNICPNVFFSLPTCGAGQQFSKGATVELIQDARLFNLKANKDRGNLFTGSGAINFPLDGSGTFTFPVFTNTTTRDHNIKVKNGMTACSNADGVCYFYMSGGWSTFGTSTTSNATEAAAGKVQLGTISDQSGMTITSAATGAPTVVQTRYLTATGGILARKKIPLLDNKGMLSGSLLGTGTRTATTVLKGNQTFGTVSASGVNLVANLTLGTPTGNLSSTTFAAIDASNLGITISGSVGDLVMISFNGYVRRTSGNPVKTVVDALIGNNPISPLGSGATVQEWTGSDNNAYNVRFTIFNRLGTGGALTYQAVYRDYGAGSMKFEANSTLQITKMH